MPCVEGTLAGGEPLQHLLVVFSSFADLLERDGVSDATYDACEFGGDRPKRQRLRGTQRAILDHFDNKLCTNTHVHKPWKVDGRPQTSTEVAYPHPVCEQVARLLSTTTLEKRKATDSNPVMAAARKPDDSQKQRLKATTGVQPRAGRYVQMIPEHKSIEDRQVDEIAAEQLSSIKQHSKGWLRHDVQTGIDDDPREEEDDGQQPGDGSGKETRRQPETAT